MEHAHVAKFGNALSLALHFSKAVHTPTKGKLESLFFNPQILPHSRGLKVFITVSVEPDGKQQAFQ